MPGISTNYDKPYVQTVISENIETQPNVNQSPIPKNRITVDEFWRREKRKNTGLIERLYNKIKNTTGLGTGTKKVERALNDLKAGNITQKEFSQKVKDYNSSQETSAQLLGDGVSVGVSAFTFFGLNKILKFSKGFADTNKSTLEKFKKVFSKEEKNTSKNTKAFNQKMVNIYESVFKTMSSNKRHMAIFIGTAGVLGGLAKYWTLKFNRIGAEEFKVDKQIYGTKKERSEYQKLLAKGSKKKLNKERHKTNLKNFLSGAINGITMPIMLLGGIVGAPIYLVVNNLNRYFVANKTDKNKSFEGYINNLTNDCLMTGGVTAAMAVPIFKKGNYTKIFNENIEKVIKKLKDVNLKKPEFTGLSAYQEIEKELLGTDKINDIIKKSVIEANVKKSKDEKLKIVQEQAQKLIDENIFAAKMKQISNDGSALFRVLKEDCPPTRTLDEAQKYVNKNLGNGYKLTKLLGVGTVAETYFAKSPDGKEVCIKILKEGISKDKILADKSKLIDIIKNMKGKSKEEIDYLLRNADDLADGILKEVDLKNEMEAAEKLAPTTKMANMVKPIKVQNNVYVMERAKGVSLESFMKLNELYIRKEAANKFPENFGKNEIKEIEKEIEKIKSRMPGFNDVKVEKSDVNYILEQYQKVFIEQFHKVNKNGKIIHGDLHPGNIFIDPEVLKTRKGKLFTLIDTGNTIEMGAEQSLRALNFTKYIKQGNVQDITKFVLDGAKLPEGMTKEQAIEKVSGELKKCFFDAETNIGLLNDEKVLTLTDNIMQKYNIIPSSTQLNLNKSRTSARNSYSSLEEALWSLDIIKVAEKYKNGGKLRGTAELGEKGIETIFRNKKYDAKIQAQENLNLKQLSRAEQRNQKHNPNAPKTNSEDYITYKLKQMKMQIDDKTISDLV